MFYYVPNCNNECFTSSYSSQLFDSRCAVYGPTGSRPVSLTMFARTIDVQLICLLRFRVVFTLAGCQSLINLPVFKVVRRSCQQSYIATSYSISAVLDWSYVVCRLQFCSFLASERVRLPVLFEFLDYPGMSSRYFVAGKRRQNNSNDAGSLISDAYAYNSGFTTLTVVVLSLQWLRLWLPSENSDQPKSATRGVWVFRAATNLLSYDVRRQISDEVL